MKRDFSRTDDRTIVDSTEVSLGQNTEVCVADINAGVGLGTIVDCEVGKSSPLLDLGEQRRGVLRDSIAVTIEWDRESKTGVTLRESDIGVEGDRVTSVNSSADVFA